MVKAVLFDLGGVVVDYSNRYYYMYLSKVSNFSIHKVKKILEERQIGLLEKDIITLEDFEWFVADRLRVRKSDVRWYEYYIRNAKINMDMMELVKILHREYITGYITNVDRSRYEYIRKILDLDEFDYKFASCYLTKRKPERSIYEHVLKRMKIKASEAVFIDNQIENVVGAKKVGMQSFLFTNRRKLDKDLSHAGL